MVQQGLVEEVRGLIAHQELNALQTVGYRELLDHFAGKISLLQAIEAIKMSTRHYAKRQMTWFKKDATISWAAPDFSQVIQLIADS
jgi:tRNA dimethylallyltransferase